MSRGYPVERIVARLVDMELDPVYRLIRRPYRRRALGVVPSPSRFSDPRGQYAVLYAAESVRCCFWEALARNRFTHRKNRELPLSEVEDRVVAALRSVEPLALADGFLYHSRFIGHACVAIFSRALGKLEALDLGSLKRSSDFLDALDDYEITLNTPH